MNLFIYFPMSYCCCNQAFKDLPTPSVSRSGSVSGQCWSMVMLENQSQTHSQASQCIPMEAATLAAMLSLPLTFGVGNA